MGKRRFTTAQQILMLLVRPLTPWPLINERPTKRDIQTGLEVYFGKKITRRHIAHLFSQLEAAGIIKRHRFDQTQGRWGERAQASAYEILDFDKAFE